MPVRDHLLAGEVIVSEHPPFYLTSLRLLHHRQGPEGEQTLALPLERLIGVEEVKTTHHRLMVAGSALFVGGVQLYLASQVVLGGFLLAGALLALIWVLLI
jgi:Flp pilus assembly protein TadB